MSYHSIAVGALVLHLVFIVWVIFGALLTRGRPVLTSLHVASLIYSILIEVAMWPCPLTDLEQWAQRKAGIASYEGSFLIHYLEKLIYPDVTYTVLVPTAVAVCVFNLGIYVRRAWRSRRKGG